MESLGRRSALRYASLWPLQFFVVIVVAATVLFPALYMIVRAVLEIQAESFNSVFFKILGRSFLVTVAQSLVSASLVLALGLGVGTLLALSTSRVISKFASLVQGLGAFAFVLPTVSISLLVLDLGRHVSWLPSKGFWAIVFAHFLLNILFISSIVHRRCRAWLDVDGKEICEAVATLGAESWAFYRQCFAPLWKECVLNWFPLVFLWSFTAFATVVILGGSPYFASPEVLLFYSLQNDLDSSRILLLLFSQLFLVAVIVRKGILRKRHSGFSMSLSPSPEKNPSPLFFSLSVKIEILLLLGLLVLFAPFVWLLLAPVLFVFKGARLEATLAQAFFNTAALSAFSALFSVIWAFCLMSVGTEIRKFFSYLLGFSTTLLMSFWMSLGWDAVFEGQVFAQLAVAAFALSLVQMPLSAYWIESRIRSLSEESFEAAETLGANRFGALRRLIYPQLKDVLAKLGFLAAITSVGELALAQLFVRDAELVAGLSQRMMLHYDFSGAYWLLIFLVLVTAAFYGVFRRCQKI